MRIQALSCSSRAQIDHRQRYHGAAMGTEAVRFLVLWMAGWINSRQLEVIDFLREENRVLREQLGGRRLRFTDDQRRRLAVKGPDRRPSQARRVRGAGHTRHDPALVPRADRPQVR
jgi:hypothetical protein